MATKKSSVSFAQIMKDLKAGIFKSIYVLMGDESYYIDQISNYIAEHALKPEERDFNQTVVFGADVSAAQITDMARRYPMMAERQVIIVKEAQNIKGLEALEHYLSKPAKSTILVWCYKNGTIDGRKKVIALAEQAGVVFESKKLRDWQLPDFIAAYLKGKNATIDRKACQMIADHIGADLNRLISELDKVLITLPDADRRVTPEVVEEKIGVSKDFNGFELRDAIVARNVFKANQIIKYFDTNPKAGSLYSFLPLLFSYFQNLMIAHYAPNKKSDQDLAAHLGLRSTWGVRDYLAGMRNYSARKTMDIIGKIREIDAKSKGIENPSTSQGDLMKELIFFILH